MKKIIICALALVVMACKKEGEQPTISGLEGAVLHSSADDIQLDVTTRKGVALQLVWNEATLNTEQPIAASALKNTLQLSIDASFATIAKSVEQVPASLSYTHEQLNNLVLGMGFLPAEKKTLYVRVVSSLSRNSEAVYSNVLAIDITAYEPVADANYLYVANKELTQFPWKLCSRKEDGVYDGFVKVDPWYNFYLTNEESASASLIYGSYPVNGNQYILYSGDDRWNCWTTNGGYLYLSADVNKLSWKETVVESLAVTGDFNGWSTTATPMIYDSSAKVWKASITTTAAQQWGIKVLINGSWTWFFGAAEQEGVCSLYTSDASGFAFDKVGTHTLILDLSDPQAFRYVVE
ncbi:DUF5111 domain-containing protein [Sphingobacterium sp. LRF_L2]|uniref:DUF5111 domain-containing protein n=1 Tax=Sphingobacterium sp. LRF_L2 TaxID=3369421 RepID=UPI003F648E27